MTITDTTVAEVRREMDRLEARFRDWKRNTVTPMDRERGGPWHAGNRRRSPGEYGPDAGAGPVEEGGVSLTSRQIGR